MTDLTRLLVTAAVVGAVTPVALAAALARAIRPKPYDAEAAMRALYPHMTTINRKEDT